jgi:hypothetical protein
MDHPAPEPDQTDRVGRTLQIVAWTILSIFGVVVLIAILVDVTGAFQEMATYELVNDTGQTLILVGVRTEERRFETMGETELDTMEPGEVYAEPLGDCEDLVLVARTESGDEYAREPHQMCAEDTWIISGPN